MSLYLVFGTDFLYVWKNLLNQIDQIGLGVSEILNFVFETFLLGSKSIQLF